MTAEAYVAKLLKKAQCAKANAEQKPNVTQAEKDDIDRKIEICEYLLSLIEKESRHTHPRQNAHPHYATYITGDKFLTSFVCAECGEPIFEDFCFCPWCGKQNDLEDNK